MKLTIFAGLVLCGDWSVFPSREECLTIWMDQAKEQFPDYACAIFSADDYTMYGSRYHYKLLHCVNFLFERVCATRGSTGSWMERIGDGGMMNWRYDPTAFTRDGARIWVK